jgi:hypothetical protein
LSIDELIEGQRRNALIASATGETLTSRLGVRREKGGRDVIRRGVSTPIGAEKY